MNYDSHNSTHLYYKDMKHGTNIAIQVFSFHIIYLYTQHAILTSMQIVIQAFSLLIP